MKHIVFAAMLLLAQGWGGQAWAHTDHGLAERGGITTFHGLTMMEFWGEWVAAIAGFIGESGKPLVLNPLGIGLEPMTSVQSTT